jgi:hypothetical protein
MYEIEMAEMSQAFFPCWKAAGLHLSRQVDGGIQARHTKRCIFIEWLTSSSSSFEAAPSMTFAPSPFGKARGRSSD